jgi:predicted nucleic acid-binding protein
MSACSVMRPSGLIDTSALIALVDTADRWHSACLEAATRLSHPIATTAAVFAEFLHFRGQPLHHLQAAWRLARSRSIKVLPIDDDDLPELERLMLKYADRPMDFADATLVRLAEREGLTTILTVDRDFHVYRIGGRKAFRVLPKR